MKIRIVGKSPKITNKEIRYATHYMADLIISKKLKKNLELTIKLSDYLYEGNKKTTFQADCCWEDRPNKPREFKIRMATRFGKRKQLLALAHELVHVKQYATGEMAEGLRGRGHTKWKQEPYFYEDPIHYFDQPWEIDAYGRELGMYVRYIDHCNKNKIKFE